MRIRAAFLMTILSCSWIATVSSAQLLVMYASKADDFIMEILKTHADIEDCATRFDPRQLLRDIDVRDHNFKYWQEDDPLAPGGVEHMTLWTFPGLTILAATHFDMYGPSTWLVKIKISDPSVRLDENLQTGESFDKFVEKLEMSDDMKRTGRLSSYRGDVTFDVDAAGVVSSLSIECVAD